MTRRTRILVTLGALVVAIALAVTFAVIQHRTPPVSPTQTVPSTWQTARTMTMHETHLAKTVACASCHVAGFETKPTEAVCTGCHAEAAAHAHHGNPQAPTTCATCHAFAKGAQDATCVSCHGAGAASPMSEAGSTDAARASHALARHIAKDTACSACHDVHGGAPAKPRTVLANCQACHTSTTAQHGRVATLADAGTAETSRVCSACHAPHAPAAAANESCATCHVGGAATRARGSDDAAKSGEILLAGFAPRIEPRGPHVAGHAACTTCHEPHRAEKADAKRCEDCHADHRAATTAAGHTACTGCHAPHAPTEARASCATAGCHAGKAVLAAASVKAHAACASCHDPHNPTASPALACVRCHENVQSKHPGLGGQAPGAATCIGCHAPHGPTTTTTGVASSAATKACSSCHKQAHGGDRALHAGGVACTTCHKPHDFASQLLHNAAGGPAHGLPAPAAKGEEAALCATCHAAMTAAVAARPGHAECGACHGAPHRPVKKPACASCHAQETASAPRGHSQCTQCHDAHSGSLGTHVACVSCHADKPKEHHGSIAGGCASCHTPHGPKGVLTPPACVTCHAKPTLDGLHSIAAHNGNCASCHSSHGPVKSDRATCTTSCHADRRNHQPDALVCKGCHMFRK